MVDAATRRKFEALVSAAFIDGMLAAPEREVLRKKAAQMNLPVREMNEIIAMGEQRKLSVSIPPSTMEREALLEDLIEVVSADGRVEAPEYHLLARFAETLKISLPDLRTRVNRRMQAMSEPPRRETVRSSPPPSRQTPLTAAPKRAEPPPAPAFQGPQFSADALPPMVPPTAKHVDAAFPKDVNVADIPPVTLQLLRQSIMFDTESDSIANIGRTLSVPPSTATEIRLKILAAFPDLKPVSHQIRPARK